MLLCSTAPRAEQGGRILIEILQIPESNVEFHRCLWDDNGHPGDEEQSKKLVDTVLKDQALVLVLSHLDMVPIIARHAQSKLGITQPIPRLDYGEAILVTAEKTVHIR